MRRQRSNINLKDRWRTITTTGLAVPINSVSINSVVRSSVVRSSVSRSSVSRSSVPINSQYEKTPSWMTEID